MDGSMFIGTWWSLVPPLLAIVLAFAKNECPLLELQTSRISLEEVFLELTQNDAVGEEERTNAGNL